MRKILLLLIGIFIAICVNAQSGKKTRNTASNSKEAVTERAISNRFNQGLRQYYTAQYDEALQSFSSILTDAPKHAPSYFMLARVYTMREQFTEAENAMKQAVKLDKENIWYQVALARASQKNGNYKEALPMWEKICRVMPDNADYLTALMECYQNNGKPDKADEVRNRLNELMPAPTQESQKNGSSTVPNGSGNYKDQGIALLLAKDYAKAADLLEQALRDDDTDFEIWSAFAEAVDKSKQWSRLTDKEEDLTTIFPQSAVLLAALAHAYLQTGHPDQAIEFYKQAKTFSYDPELTKSIRKGLFDAYTQAGDSENAERYR